MNCHTGVGSGSILPSDVELLVILVETSIQVVDSVGGSFSGSSTDGVTVASTFSGGGDASDVEIEVGSGL